MRISRWFTAAALALGMLDVAGYVLAQQGQQQSPPPAKPTLGQPHDMAGMDMSTNKQAEAGAMDSMAHMHHSGPHMQMTTLRPATPGDQDRADAILKLLRASIEKYKDYRVAIGDGFQPFLPNLKQPEYHFTNYKFGYLAAYAFDPAQPTSLLYRKTSDGYELVGAMYTMPRTASEEELNKRVPLSLARWHLHTNLCMPPKDQMAHADWTKFGLQGSIATEEACKEAGGNFTSVIFGWMVHVYPFADSPDKIWAH